MANIYIDNSGSVGDDINYWYCVKNILDKHSDNIKNYYLWNTLLSKATKEEVEQSIEKKIGTGGTVISNVALNISENNVKDLIVITDGVVDINEVNKCEGFLKEELENCYCYIISKYAFFDDISVVLPFIRKSTNSYILNSSLTIVKSFHIEDFKLLDKDFTYEELYERFDYYYDLINLKNMGKSGLSLIKNKLISMRNDFIRILNKDLKDLDNIIILKNKLVNKETDTNELIKKIDENFYNGLGNENSKIKKFDKLIELCNDRSSCFNNSFSLRFNNLNCTTDIKPDICDIDDKYNFEDPIMLELDVPQLIIVEGDDIYNNDIKKLKSFIENPLDYLNDKELTTNILNRIGHVIGIKTTSKINIDPFTRKRIIATIPLTTDNEQHLKVGNNAIYSLFTNKKIIGNSSLYFIVLWNVINKIEFLSEYKDFIDNHLKYRLENTKSYISLTGLPDYNRTFAPIDVCLYYVLNSNDDILRKHIFNSDIIIYILNNIFNYELNPERLLYINKTKIMLNMLYLTKQNKKEFETNIKCLTNNHIKTSYNQLIIIDTKNENSEEVLKLFPEYYKNVNIEDIIYISSLVNPNLSAKNIIVNNETPKKFKSMLFKKVWFDYDFDTNGIKISLKTLRPYYYHNWVEMAEKQNKEKIENQLSCYNDYIRCYLSNKKFPTLEEFIIYNYKRYNKPIHSKLEIMFSVVLNNYKEVLEYIKKNNMQYQEIKKCLIMSCSVKNRTIMQESD